MIESRKIINEASRSDLLNKSKNADVTKSYGTTRYDRRTAVNVFNTDKNFNNIDMNALFKSDVLSLMVPIHGEHGNYEVEVFFKGVCSDIKKEIKKSNYNFEYKCVYRSIISAINNQDIFVGCSCQDFKYRFNYWATKQRYSSMKPQLVPADQTNPKDSQGAGCKHILNVLDNLDWALKLASSIYNYIVYMSLNYTDKFKAIMFPALFDMSWDEAVKKGIVEDPDNEEINLEDDNLDSFDEEPIEEPEEEISDDIEEEEPDNENE